MPPSKKGKRKAKEKELPPAHFERGYKLTRNGGRSFYPKKRPMKYEKGRMYRWKGEVRICASGFHYCATPLECLLHVPQEDVPELWRIHANPVTGPGESGKFATDAILMDEKVPSDEAAKLLTGWVADANRMTYFNRGHIRGAVTHGTQYNLVFLFPIPERQCLIEDLDAKELTDETLASYALQLDDWHARYQAERRQVTEHLALCEMGWKARRMSSASAKKTKGKVRSRGKAQAKPFEMSRELPPAHFEKGFKLTRRRGRSFHPPDRPVKYDQGRMYRWKGEVKICNSGFHYCATPLECLLHVAEEKAPELWRVRANPVPLESKHDKRATDQLFMEEKVPTKEAARLLTGWVRQNDRWNYYNAGLLRGTIVADYPLHHVNFIVNSNWAAQIKVGSDGSWGEREFRKYADIMDDWFRRYEAERLKHSVHLRRVPGNDNPSWSSSNGQMHYITPVNGLHLNMTFGSRNFHCDSLEAADEKIEELLRAGWSNL